MIFPISGIFNMSKSKSNPYKTVNVEVRERVREAKDAANNLRVFVEQITSQHNESLIKPMSVELRKLLSPHGRGNDLLSRLEKELNVNLVFPDRAKTLPPAMENVGLDSYRNNLIFAVGGRPVTRLDLICMIADEKGAHTDDLVDQMHSISQRIVLPLGNPARDGLLFEQNTTYLLTIAKTVAGVIEGQIR
jgi:hypothetical protein